MFSNTDYHTMNDEQLWHRILAEDSSALKEVYYRHYDLLLNYGIKFCGNRDLVQDSIHDLFLKIFGNKKLSQIKSIAPYLLKSLKNMLIEKILKQEELIHIEFASQPEIWDIDQMLEEYFKNDDEAENQLKKLIAAYSDLSEKQRQILYLRFVKEMNFKEIALFMEINVQSAMNLSFRALSKLRNDLTNNNKKKE